jgi:hypothetical protein
MHKFWQNTAVQLGLEHHHLLESIFAFAALHLAQTTPDNSQQHLTYAMRYHDRALSAYQTALTRLEPEQYDAIFLSSILLFMYVFAYMCGDAGSEADDLFSSFRWLGTARGMTILRKSGISLLQSGPLGKMFGPAWANLRTLNEAPARTPGTSHLDGLADLWTENTEQTPDRYQLYAQVLADLQTAFARTERFADHKIREQSGEAVESFIERLRWLAELPDSFADLLVAHDPIALIMLCHSFKLFDSAVCSYWWTHSNSRVFEQRIRRILDHRYHSWLGLR